ncbi:gamma-glutamylputrescine oxidase [Hasllibacter halocynthiae]|uniref:Gamma-glutamylputrescine oxidase n=1 Tax=Hasllibacter halocynthiae TaxID=595589 RepID=A0A2T0X6X8_9RHOB|nr:FAD-binding oxidoreductase [Hasllibacter halocynthiae]PRY94677.1 gamma-glutamylputrescine oxidase [Hasllibacter halocynthiae]
MKLLYANDPPSGYPASWYAETAEAPPEQPPLRGEVRCDLCVVGAGYTGLAAALAARAKGLDVVLLDARRAGWGASGRNGGQVGTGQRVDQITLEARHGPGAARRLWDLGQDAVAECRRLVEAHAPEACWRPGIAFLARSARAAEEAHRYADHLAARYDYHLDEPLDREAARALSGSEAFAGGSLDRGGAHIHPLRLAFGMARAALAAGVRLHEGTPAHRLSSGPVVHTDRGRVLAERVILAGNGYLEGFGRPQVMPINNFIVATEPLDGPLTEDVAAHDDRFVVDYWRKSEDGRLLFGGGESYGYRFPKDVAALVRRPMEAIYPQLRGVRITHAWGGTLGITISRMPHMAAMAPGVLSAAGYSGHGVAMACLAGRLAAEASAGPSPGWEAMAALPHRAFPGGTAFRTPLLATAMSWYALRDRLGI